MLCYRLEYLPILLNLVANGLGVVQLFRNFLGRLLR